MMAPSVVENMCKGMASFGSNMVRTVDRFGLLNVLL